MLTKTKPKRANLLKNTGLFFLLRQIQGHLLKKMNFEDKWSSYG
jgi:hypothetical protein